MQTSRFAFYLLLALAVLQVVVFYPRLPDVMASHFDASGQADGWMSKTTFLAIHVGTLGLTAVLFLALPAIRWPDRWVNLPHKDYWLAPERREETFRYLHGQFFLFGCLTLGFLLIVMQWVMEANLDGSHTLPAAPMWWLVGGYLFLTSVWTVRLVRHFYRVPAEASPSGSP